MVGAVVLYGSGSYQMNQARDDYDGGYISYPVFRSDYNSGRDLLMASYWVGGAGLACGLAGLALYVYSGEQPRKSALVPDLQTGGFSFISTF